MSFRLLLALRLNFNLIRAFLAKGRDLLHVGVGRALGCPRAYHCGLLLRQTIWSAARTELHLKFAALLEQIATFRGKRVKKGEGMCVRLTRRLFAQGLSLKTGPADRARVRLVSPSQQEEETNLVSSSERPFAV